MPAAFSLDEKFCGLFPHACRLFMQIYMTPSKRKQILCKSHSNRISWCLKRMQILQKAKQMGLSLDCRSRQGHVHLSYIQKSKCIKLKVMLAPDSENLRKPSIPPWQKGGGGKSTIANHFRMFCGDDIQNKP